MADNHPKQDLVFTQIFDAPLEKVWAAWTKPEMLKIWWGPDQFQCPTAIIDFREGGTSLVSMASPALGFPEQFSTWHYQKIEPMQRFEYLHNLSDKEGHPIDPVSVDMPADFPKNMHFVIMFEDLEGGKTRLTVTEKDWPMGQMMEMSKLGMKQCLNKLDQFLR